MKSEANFINQPSSAYVRPKNISLNNSPFKNIRLCSSSTGSATTGETFMNTFTPITQTTVTSTENFMNNLSTYTASSLEKSAMPRRGVPFGEESLKDFKGVLAHPITQNISFSMLEDGTYTFKVADFPFSDGAGDNDTFKSVRVKSLPSNGDLFYNGSAVTSDQEILVADISKLTFII